MAHLLNTSNTPEFSETALSVITLESILRLKQSENLLLTSESLRRLTSNLTLSDLGLLCTMYLQPKYISPCHAGSLFGIITASGQVYPCEILEDKMIGDLRENDMNFMKIWDSATANSTKEFILKTKCNCSYECALTYNILGNWRYQPSLISSILKY